MSSADEREILREISYLRREVAECQYQVRLATERGDDAEAAAQRQLAEQSAHELTRVEGELAAIAREREQA